MDKGLHGRHWEQRASIVGKWQAYLDRLKGHVGLLGGVHCVHCKEDDLCPWDNACAIFEALGARQKALGLPMPDIDEVPLNEAKRKKSRHAHAYHDRAFCRAERLEQLLPPNLRPRCLLSASPTSFGDAAWSLASVVGSPRTSTQNSVVGVRARADSRDKSHDEAMKGCVLLPNKAWGQPSELGLSADRPICLVTSEALRGDAAIPVARIRSSPNRNRRSMAVTATVVHQTELAHVGKSPLIAKVDAGRPECQKSREHGSRETSISSVYESMQVARSQCSHPRLDEMVGPKWGKSATMCAPPQVTTLRPVSLCLSSERSRSRARKR